MCDMVVSTLAGGPVKTLALQQRACESKALRDILLHEQRRNTFCACHLKLDIQGFAELLSEVALEAEILMGFDWGCKAKSLVIQA